MGNTYISYKWVIIQNRAMRISNKKTFKKNYIKNKPIIEITNIEIKKIIKHLKRNYNLCLYEDKYILIYYMY